MTSNLKEEIIELIKELPENATIDDIMYHLYVKKKSSQVLKKLS
jgi:predicted Zn-ribbon and HTH transcriptional regulator